jgi:hypothetical protein
VATKRLAIDLEDEFYDWLVRAAFRDDMTIKELVIGHIVSETGQRYVLPDGRHFSFRASIDRGYEPLISPGAVRRKTDM